jgi:serine protease Do/serine protease DegQ
MKKLSFVFSAALISSSLALTSLPLQAKLPIAVNGQTMPSLAPMLEQVTPAVVSITVKGTQKVEKRVPDAFKFFFGNPRQQQPQQREFSGMGSGVIVDAQEGYVVTNNHVIEHADEILVTLQDGRQLKAKKIGTDASSDIALLQMEAKSLTAIKISDSDELRVGDYAVAIGSPFGLGQTVTSGIVSALGRTGLNRENFEDFIQTDAAINSGNSGGALVNLRGELIGINTAIYGPNGGNVGIGFAIPSNMMNNLISQIIEFGEIRRGVLGVIGGDVNSEIAKAMELKANQGGFIQQIVPDSAAATAGLKAGDVIIKVDGKMVKSFNEIRGKIGSIGAGKEVDITFIRDGKEKTTTAKLKKTQSGKIAAGNIHRMLEGAELENGSDIKGIEVTKVAKGSPAEAVGLKRGDVITGVNKTRTGNLANLRSFFKDKEGVFALNIIRDDMSLYLMIR